MENKYYTPTIEEFHIGFECEYKSQELIGEAISKIIDLKLMYGKELEVPEDDLFEHHVINGRDIQMYSLNPHLLKDFRVKRLDREDIESLGWDQVEYDTYRLGTQQEFFFEFNPEYKSFIYSKTNKLNSSNVIFMGTIKNKSELKKLMQQLDIK
jgi:hypothetical protein